MHHSQMLYGNTTLEFNCTYVAARDVAEAHYQALARYVSAYCDY